VTRRGIVIAILVLLLGGLAIFASIQLLATEKVVYLAPDETGPDPFTPPAVFTSDSPGPPAPIDPSVPITTPSNPESLGDNPGPVGGTTKKGDCDAELLIQYLNANPEIRAIWLEKLGVLVDDFEDYLRNATPALLSRDTRATTFGLKEGAAVDIQTIMATGTSVLVNEEGDIVVRCFSGSPLGPPRQIKYNCTSCPPDLPPPPPCNRTCYNVPSATPPATSSSTTTSTTAASSTTTTTRQSTTTTARSAAARTPTTRRRGTTTTRTNPPAPVTATLFSTQPNTFAPAATNPPATTTTQPPPPATAATIIQTFPPAATTTPTTQPPTTTNCDLLGLDCLF
jgi:uncharacterized protein DUF6777